MALTQFIVHSFQENLKAEYVKSFLHVCNTFPISALFNQKTFLGVRLLDQMTFLFL